MRWYVSGPMRGIPHWNFEAFDEASAWLRAGGHDVVSPAEHDIEVDPSFLESTEYLTGADVGVESFHQLIGWDLKVIADPDPDVRIDALALLPDWENSIGVKHEMYVARATGKRAFQLMYDETGPCGLREVYA